MVQEDKNIKATVVNTGSSQSDTRTDREMSEDKINNNITSSIPSCTVLDNDRHQENVVLPCEGKAKELNIELESDGSKSKDDIEISGNSEKDSAVIEEDNSNEFSNTIEDSQSKEYNEINEQERNDDSDFVMFIKESDVYEMTRGSDSDEYFLCTNGCVNVLDYCDIHEIRGRPDGCEEKQRKTRDVIQENTVGSDSNVRIAESLYETWLKRDQSYDTQNTDVGFSISTINEIIFEGSSNREDPDGCEEDTRTDSMDVKKQDCSMFMGMQILSRKPYDMQLFLLKTDTITLVWIIVKMGIVVTATVVFIVKLMIVITASIVSFVKLEMVVMNLVNEFDINIYASQQGQLVTVSEIKNPIHTKVNNDILSIESEDYIEFKWEDGEMQDKEVSFTIIVIDIDNKEVAIEVQNEKDSIESNPASDNSQQNENGINSGQLVVEGQCIDEGNDGRKLFGQMKRKVGGLVGAKVWFEENEIVDEKADGNLLEKDNDFDDIGAATDILDDKNELVCQRVDSIQGKADDIHGVRKAAKAREDEIEIYSEKTEKEDDINAKTSVKEIQVCEIPNKKFVIGDNKAADDMIRKDEQSDNDRAIRELVEKVEEPIGKSKRQHNDFDEEKDQTSGIKSFGELLKADDEKAACSNSDKDEKCPNIGGSSDIIKMQGEEIKENRISRGQTENIDDRKAVGIKIEDNDHTKTVNATGDEDNLKDKTVFDEQDDKEGTNVLQVKRSGPTTRHSVRDWNDFQTIVMLLLICGVPCARGASSELSTKVTWSLQTNPVVFGSNATLCCIIQGPETRHMAWVRNPKTMVLATGNSSSYPMKYSALVEPIGNTTYYLLTIINIDMTDVNVNYKCESNFDLFEQKLDLREESFVMKPLSNETIMNITRENGMISVALRMRNMFPKPECFFSSKKAKMNGNVSLDENGKLYNVKMGFSISEDMCGNNITAYCALGKEIVLIDISSSNNSWTRQCPKDRHGDNYVFIVTVVIILTLVFIVVLIYLVVKKYFARTFGHAFKQVLNPNNHAVVHV